MKHCLIVATIIAILMPVPGAYAQASGTVHGVVRNRSEDKLLPDHEVILERHTQEEEHHQTKGMTDAEGRFRFENLPMEDGVHYMLQVTYLGQTYSRESIHLSADSPTQEVELLVYNVGSEADQIKIGEQQVWFARVPQVPAAAQVREFARVHNHATTAYVDAEGVGLRLALPPGHQHAKTMDSVMEADFVVEGDEMVYRAPLPPGETVFAYSYVILAQPQAELSRAVTLDTDVFFLLVSDTKMQPQSTAFQPGSTQEADGVIYQTYGTGNIAKGQMVPALLVEGTAAEGTEESDSGKQLLLWSAIIFGMVAIVAVAAMVARRRPATGKEIVEHPPARAADPADLEGLRDARLELIAHLDDMLESRQLTPELHEQLRDEQKQKLAAIMQQLNSG